ncbi:MAG: hypothetical protein HOU81_05430 [Hamadaea sp.]|nr:hypothetical protein [Hamadaea sp.]NUT22058.1 hypothetical protein [Hamadaea sp.]
MTALAAWQLGRPALWADELATVNAAVLPWDGLRQLLGQVDLVMAPYYTVMHIWTAIFGTSEIAVRLPSALAGIATVAVTAQLGARLWDRRAGVIAGVLLAVLPAFSRYAQEARAYSLAVFALTLATLLLVRWIERPGALRLVAYAVVLGVGVLLGPFGAMILAAHAVLAWRGRFPWSWAISAAGAVLPGMALFAMSALTQRDQTSWIRRLTLEGANGVVERGLTVAGPVAVTAALIVLGLLAVRKKQPVLAMACWSFLPIVLLLAAGLVTPVWVARYVFFTLPGFALLAASWLRQVSLARSTAVVVAVALFGAGSNIAIRRPAGHGQDSRRIAAIIGPRFQAGDVVIYGDNHPSIPWSPRDVVARYLPAGKTPRDVLMISPQRADGHLLAVECGDVSACVGDAARIWVVRADNPADPRTGLDGGKSPFLAEHYSVNHVWRYPLLTVALLDRTH